MCSLTAFAALPKAITTAIPPLPLESQHGSACGPVTIAVFKTVDRRLSAAMVGSTPTRFRHFISKQNRELRHLSSASNCLVILCRGNEVSPCVLTSTQPDSRP